MARNEITMRMTPESKRELEKMSKAELKPELRAALVSSTAPAVPAVRAAARALPSKTPGRRTRDALRSQIAMAVQRRIGLTSTRGIWVAIVSQPKGGLSNLARAVEGEIPWHHPLFGHDPEIEQPPKPYFYHTLEKLIPGIEVRVRQALITFEAQL